jgi:hypothetical protein
MQMKMLLLTTLLLIHRSLRTRKRTGCLPKWDRPELRAAVAQVPKSKRNTFRSLSSAVAVPKSTLFDMLTKERLFRRNTAHDKGNGKGDV